MKKFLCLFLALVMCLSLCACKTSNSIPIESELTDSELTEVTQLLADAVEQIEVCIYELNITKRTWLYLREEYYQDDDELLANFYENNHFTNDRAEVIYNTRKIARENLNNAKTLLQKGGGSDHYNAVKSYYMTVKTYADLIFEWPGKYNYYEYTDAMEARRNKCITAYTEATFYE